MNGISYLFSLAKWTKEKPFNLDTIHRVLEYLNNPQDRVKTIIVTGTNGKGSVSALISSILGAAGYTVGLNTSPHLCKINERIVINGFSVSDSIISDTGLKLKAISDNLGLVLSFHEAITVCSFIIFNNLKLDWQVLEVGLGGRLDAANTVKNPVISVLVSVDYDHQAILGNTLKQIAYEKAGIFRAEGTAIIGRMEEEVGECLKQYNEKNRIKSICYGIDFYIEKHGNGEHFYKDADNCEKIDSSLQGEHQFHNISLAIAACRKLGISMEACRAGIKNVFWPGRLEYISCNGKEVLLDCAHNPAGIRALISYIKSRAIKDINLGFGVISSKNWKEMVDSLIPYVKTWSLLTPPTDTAINSIEVQKYLSLKNISSKNYDMDYRGFFDQVSKEYQEQVILTGSIYLIGALRSILTQEVKPLWILKK